MPTKQNGQLDWSKLFMGFSVAFVLALQQWQAYRIAEIKATSENFMHRDEVIQRLDHMDDKFMQKEELLVHLERIERSSNGSSNTP